MAERTHDRELYLAESRYAEPKEIFKRLADLAEKSGSLRDGGAVADIGCAAGEFLHYLARRFPEATLLGYDVVPELLAKAREQVPGVSFAAGSVLDPELAQPASFDVAFLVGVHSIFDEFETPIANLVRWMRPGGRAYVFGLFNPHPVDVWVSYRVPGVHDKGHRESGWNVFSKGSVSAFLDTLIGPDAYRFLPFEMPFDLSPNPSDPVRSWTFRTDDGRRLFTNGLSQIVNLEILELRP